MVDLVIYAAATRSLRLNDALTYTAMITDALPEILEVVRASPPRKHLRFWVAFAGGQVTSHTNGQTNPGFDLRISFSNMSEAGIDAVMAGLEHPETERMMERYAFAATDRAWLTYLSRLLKWRGNTVLATLWSERGG